MSSTDAAVGHVVYKRSPAYAWAVAMGAFFGQLILIFSMKNLYIALSTIAQDFGLTSADLAVWASVMGVFYGVAGILWGFLIDKFGCRKVMSVNAFLTAGLVIAIAAFVYDVAIGCVFMALLGILFAGADDAVIPKLITTWFHPSKRGLGFPLVTLGGAIGGVICGILAGNFIEMFGWRGDFYIMGGICVVLAIILTFLIRDTPASVGTVPFGSPEGTPVEADEMPKAKTKAEKKASKDLLVRVLKDPATYKFGLVMIVWYFWFSNYQAYLVAAAQDIGFPVSVAALTTSMASLGCAVGFFIWPPLTNRLGRKPIFIFLMAMEGLVTICLYFLFESGITSEVILLGSTLVMGLFVSSAPVMQHSLGEQFRPSVRGTGSGAAATISAIGRLAGPMLAAAVIVAMGSTHSYFLFSGGSAIAAGILVVFLVKNTGGKYGDPMAELEAEERRAALNEAEKDEG